MPDCLNPNEFSYSLQEFMREPHGMSFFFFPTFIFKENKVKVRGKAKQRDIRGRDGLLYREKKNFVFTM